MRFMQLVVVIGLVWVSAAVANDGQAALHPASATSASASGADRELVHRQAEVKQLERDLGRQESNSKRAGERLQRQDQAIAELRKQLQELQASQATGQH